MKIFAIAVLLFASVCGAQKHKCTVDVPERIPHDAVEPAWSGGSTTSPFCPRSEYEIKWYVVEDNEQYLYDNGWKSRTKLVFKPMCAVREDLGNYTTSPWISPTPIPATLNPYYYHPDVK